MKIGNIELHVLNAIDCEGYYWYFDYRLSDDKSGVFIESIVYDTEKQAIDALISQNIKWEISEGTDYEVLL